MADKIETGPGEFPGKHAQADALVRALLATIREMRGPVADKTGRYTLTAELAEDGSYGWKWLWYPATGTSGGGHGGGTSR
jgi:hypothetical protein